MKPTHLSTLLLALALATPSATAQSPMTRLKVSDNQRFLVYEDGRPFFYLGDTAWELFHRLNREEADRYLAGPRAQGLHRHPGGGARRARRARRPESLRAPAAGRQRSRAAGREGGPGERLLGPRGLHRREGQLARALRRLPADVGRQVEQEVGRRARDLHRRERGRLRRVAGPALPRQRRHLDPRRRPAGRDRGPEGDHPRDGARPAQGRRRRAPDDVPSAGRQRLLGVVPRRGVARLQHAAERPRRRVHRPLRHDARRLRPHAGRSRCSTASRSTRTTPSRSTPTKLGHSIAADVRRPLYWDLFTGRLRPHLRPPLGLADVGAGARADQQPAHAVVRGHRPAGRRPDAVRAGASSSRARS